jgi:hypothetical protein
LAEWGGNNLFAERQAARRLGVDGHVQRVRHLAQGRRGGCKRGKLVRSSEKGLLFLRLKGGYMQGQPYVPTEGLPTAGPHVYGWPTYRRALGVGVGGHVGRAAILRRRQEGSNV